MMANDPASSLWFNGRIVAWKEGVVHVWSELTIRGASVFEGIRAYWDERNDAFRVVALDAHVRRLYESARLLRIPVAIQREELTTAISDLLGVLDLRADAYIRPTLYLDQGRYGFELADVVPGAYVVAFAVERSPLIEDGARCCVSSWRRAGDLVLPPRAKTGAAYQALRLPIIEARQRGFDDAILLNDRDTVAEATAAAVFLVRDGRVIVPPLSAGGLESITRARVIDLLRDVMGVVVVEQEVQRSELYLAEEVFLCGTLCEVQPVVAVDDLTVGSGAPGVVTVALRDLYLDLCTGTSEQSPPWVSVMRIPNGRRG